MKSYLAAAAGVIIVALSAIAGAQGEKDAAKDASKTAPKLNDLTTRFSYSLGISLGRQMKSKSIEIDPDILAEGMKDAMAGKPQLTDKQMQEIQTEFQKMMIAKQGEILEKRKKEGEAFLAANKKKPGIKTTASGLQYQVLKEGTGPSPKASDTVTVNYEGTLIDGTVFDSSYKRGKPLNGVDLQGGVIPGWTEVLKLMKVGSKWRVFIPTELAYGDHPRGGVIQPNDPLIFQIELLSID